ncbi:MAG TPA: acetyl-CoA carboxylase biotin carboxyl carrier protein [Herpetosiphonaceae bacterium]
MADADRNDALLTDEVRDLVALIKDTDIAEVLIERGDAKLHIKRAVPQATLAPQVVIPAQQVPTAVVMPAAANGTVMHESAAVPEEFSGHTVTAPMVGTFYMTPAPKDPPYVQVGDEVKPGDVLGIIEAMKIMNEIECEVHGRVKKIIAEHGQPVEYGQTLMLIELM